VRVPVVAARRTLVRWALRAPPSAWGTPR